MQLKGNASNISCLDFHYSFVFPIYYTLVLHFEVLKHMELQMINQNAYLGRLTIVANLMFYMDLCSDNSYLVH